MHNGQWSMVDGSSRQRGSQRLDVLCCTRASEHTRVKLCVCVVWLLLECVGKVGNANELEVEVGVKEGRREQEMR